MVSEAMRSAVSRMYREGKSPSEILREVLVLAPDSSVAELMDVMEEGLSLPYSAVQCIGGWWHDGTGELSDSQLDALMTAEIVKVHGA
jgi:hypothetical protein